MPPNVVLVPDVSSRIVRWARRCDLAALCLACRSLQRDAEPRLYEIVMSAHVQIVFRASQSIAAHPRLGPYVRTFGFLPDTRRVQRDVPEQFWATLQLALSRMRELDHLFLQDPTLANGWVLSDVAHIPFQLLEARLLFRWDAHLVKFLESQNKLKSLHTVDGPANDPTLHLEAGSLSELRIFDGTLAAAEHIVHVGASLSHLQLALDKNSEADVLPFIPKLSRLASSLRALNILHLPEGLSVDVFRSITKTCPRLRHVGTIPLPLPRHVSRPLLIGHYPRSLTRLESYRFHDALMALGHLQVLEVDVSSWSPPATGVPQRTIAADIRIYSPSIEYICFWAGVTRALWAVDGNDWSCHSESGHPSQFDALWKTR